MKVMRRLTYLFKLFIDPFFILINNWPGDLGNKLRCIYYRRKLKYLGKNVIIDIGVHFQNPQYISIGDNCWIDRYVTIMAGEDKSNREKHSVQRFKHERVKKCEVIIGSNVHVGIGCIISGISAGVYMGDNTGLAPGCKIFAFSHHYRSLKNHADTGFSGGTTIPENKQCLVEGAVVLEDNVGVATNSVILPGTIIRKNSCAKVGSVLTGNFNENSVLSGNPAKRIGNRFNV